MKKTAITGVLVMAGVFASLSAVVSLCADATGNEEAAPEQKEMMAKMEAYSTPNENHALLASLAGAWDAAVEHKMSADAPVETSRGTSQNDMVFGGRFLEQSWHGEYNGQPFEGKGVMGYDTIMKHFQGVWYDSISTGIMTSTSTYDPVQKVFHEEGRFSCPITDGPITFRGVVTLNDPDHYTYEMFMKDENGKEFRMMRIQYARAK